MHCIKAGEENPDVDINAGYIWVFDTLPQGDVSKSAFTIRLSSLIASHHNYTSWRPILVAGPRMRHDIHTWLIDCFLPDFYFPVSVMFCSEETHNVHTMSTQCAHNMNAM